MKRILSITLGLIFALGSFVYASDVNKTPVKKHAHERSHKKGKKRTPKHRTHKSSVTTDPTVKYSDKQIKNAF